MSCDLKIETEMGEVGIRRLTITALQLQGEVDLDMEYPRILKLLERDWKEEKP